MTVITNTIRVLIMIMMIVTDAYCWNVLKSQFLSWLANNNYVKEINSEFSQGSLTASFSRRFFQYLWGHVLYQRFTKSPGQPIQSRQLSQRTPKYAKRSAEGIQGAESISSLSNSSLILNSGSHIFEYVNI